jgi:Sigma-70, region 4
MAAIADAPRDGRGDDPDAVIRELYSDYPAGGTMATVARELGIPHGTASSRLHYALDAMRKQPQEHDAIAASS